MTCRPEILDRHLHALAGKLLVKPVSHSHVRDVDHHLLPTFILLHNKQDKDSVSHQVPSKNTEKSMQIDEQWQLSLIHI